MTPSIFIKNYRLEDYSALGLDLHNHVLPGIDDGASTVQDSSALLSGLQSLGFQSCIATPHVNLDYYPNTPATVFDAFDNLNRAQDQWPQHFIQSVAAEYLLDEAFPKMVRDETLLTLPGRRVLFELPFSQAPFNLEEQVFLMTSHGYTPVLAHPERYSYWHGSGQGRALNRLVELGCELQVNILSLFGHYGPGIRLAAYEILQTYHVEYLATDCHNELQLAALRAGLKDRHFARMMSKKQFENIKLIE